MTPNGTYDALDIRDMIAAIALANGVDLTLYGSASPTKTFTESLIAVTETIESATQISLTEQNPYTATTLKSLLGIAAVSGLNVTTYLQASKGRVKIDPGSEALTISNKMKMQTNDGILYYISMPQPFVSINNITEFDVYQGNPLTKTFSASGELHQAFVLKDDFIVDPQSIRVFVNGVPKTIGTSMIDYDNPTDFFMSLNANGDVFVMPIDSALSISDTIRVDYASCFGYVGDRATIDTRMSSSELSSMNPNKDFTIKVSIPILGGTEKPATSRELPYQILGASINNLIGNAAQLERYLKRYVYFITKVTNNYAYVLTVATCRNLRHMVETLNIDYWQAVQDVELDLQVPQDQAELDSMELQVSRLPDLQLSNIISFVPARIQYAAAILNVNMELTNHSLVSDVVAEWALKYIDSEIYEFADLLNMVNSADTVYEVTGSLICGQFVNQWGNVFRATPEHIIVFDSLYLTVNGVQQNIINPNHTNFNYNLNFPINA